MCNMRPAKYSLQAETAPHFINLKDISDEQGPQYEVCIEESEFSYRPWEITSTNTSSGQHMYQKSDIFLHVFSTEIYLLSKQFHFEG